MQLRPTAWSRPSVRSMAVAAAASAALLLSGCSEFSPQVTQLQYVPSDGAQGDLGELGVRNALLITSAPETGRTVDPAGPANFVGTLTNTGSDELTVQVTTADGAETSVQVPASGAVQIGPGSEQQWLVPRTGGIAGQTVVLTFETAGEQLELDVPVLDGTLPEYATLVPTGAPSPGEDGEATQSPDSTEDAEGTGSPTVSPRPTAGAN